MGGYQPVPEYLKSGRIQAIRTGISLVQEHFKIDLGCAKLEWSRIQLW